jgi:hypothetical protein
MTAARALWKGRGRAFDRPRLSPATNPSERAVGQPLTPFAGAPSSGGVDLYCPLRLMFGNLKARWRQARGAQLKRQFENATRWADDLCDEQAERFGRGLNHLFNDWVKRFGPVKDCDVRTRKFAVRQMRPTPGAATSTTSAPPTRSNSSPTTSRRPICRAKTPRLSTI